MIFNPENVLLGDSFSFVFVFFFSLVTNNISFWTNCILSITCRCLRCRAKTQQTVRAKNGLPFATLKSESLRLRWPLIFYRHVLASLGLFPFLRYMFSSVIRADFLMRPWFWLPLDMLSA